MNFFTNFNSLDQIITTVKKVRKMKAYEYFYNTSIGCCPYSIDTGNRLSTELCICFLCFQLFTLQMQYLLFQLCGFWFWMRIDFLLFHGAILPYWNKYCNVLQMYCHVQFYITSLEYCALGL